MIQSETLRLEQQVIIGVECDSGIPGQCVVI